MPFTRDGLEGQIVGRTLSRLLSSGRERCGLLCRSSLRLWWERCGCCGINGCSRNNIESTDLVEPTAVVLVGVDIERYGDILTHLNVELLDAVLTKHTEQTLAGILTRHFDNILL